MSEKPQVSADQLAQAAGCDPTNPCYFDCCRAWRETLEEWETLDERERKQALDLVPWIQEQEWL